MTMCDKCGDDVAAMVTSSGYALCNGCLDAFRAGGCRRCGSSVSALVAHGLPLCSDCFNWYRAIMQKSLAFPASDLETARPELADVAAVYASAEQAGIWDAEPGKAEKWNPWL